MPVLMALIIVASCGKLGELSPEYFTTTPQVLEAVGGNVPVTIHGKFPEKYLKKKAVVTVTPVLKWNGGEARSQSYTFQGEKVEGNNQTIMYKTGGNYTMKANFAYVPEMEKSELYLEFKARVGKKEMDIPAVKIADGVIATSELVVKTVVNASTGLAEDAFQRIIKKAQEANIMYLVRRTNVRASELRKQELKDFKETAKEVNESKETRRLDNIEISSYASPEGTVELNTRLAKGREASAEKYLNKTLKKNKIEATVDTKYTSEDWDGFQKLVSKSDIQDKEMILRVLSMYQDPVQRETEIRNLSSVYKVLADEILPQLRRSRLTLNYDVIGKSDETIAQMAKATPAELTVEELLYAATLTNNVAEKKDIYTKATNVYPNDFRAFNNLGGIAYNENDMAAAERFVNKAASMNANAPEVNMNLGLIALAKNDVKAAESFLGKAAGAKGLNEALGNLYVKQGQYERACNAFGDAASNSAALAQILAKDYNKAKSTLNNIAQPNAYTAYLNAVLGARTNNSAMVASNLKKAVQMDAAMAQKAMNDIEFAKFSVETIVK
jgi:Flp pilus assembly protein TadD